MIIIICLLIGLFGLMTLVAIKQSVANAILRTRLSVSEVALKNQSENIELLLKRTTPKELTQEQREFKELLELKWKTAMEELVSTLTKQLKKDGGAIKDGVDKWKMDFSTKLSGEYNNAIESIAFHTVEYKKTITKKRKEFARKNKATNPQRQHRSIDDE